MALFLFWLFPTVKIAMKSKHFESVQNIEAAAGAQLKTFIKKSVPEVL